MRYLTVRRLLFVCVCLGLGVATSAAQDASNRIILNAEKQERAYLVRNAYYQMGYLRASVQLHQEGGKDIIEVTPGNLYRLHSLKLEGNLPLAARELLEGAPKIGSVGSSAAGNLWIESLQKKLSTMGYPVRISESARIDQTHPWVDVTVELVALKSGTSGR